MRKTLVCTIIVLLVLTLLQFDLNPASCSSGQDGYIVKSNVYYDFGWPPQERLFYERGLFWLFYYDKDLRKAVYQTSANKVTWSTPSTLFTGGKSDFGVATNGTHIAYIRYGGYFRLGRLNSDGTITWVANEVYVGVMDAYSWTICFDSNGYIWASYRIGGTVYITRNTKRDGSWTTASGYPMSLGSGGPCKVLPLTAGKIAVVINDYEKVRVRAWNGSSWLPAASTIKLAFSSVFAATNHGDIIHIVFPSKIPIRPGVYDCDGITYARYEYSSNSIVKETLIYKGYAGFCLIWMSVDRNNGDVYVVFSPRDPEDFMVVRYCVSIDRWSTHFTIMSRAVITDSNETSLIDYDFILQGAIRTAPYCYDGAVPIVYTKFKPEIYGFEHCDLMFTELKPLLFDIRCTKHILSNGRMNVTVYSSFIRGSYSHIDSIRLSIADKVIVAWENGRFTEIYDPADACTLFLDKCLYRVYDAHTVEITFSLSLSGMMSESGTMPVKAVAHEKLTDTTAELTKYVRFKSFKAGQIEPGVPYYDSSYLAYLYYSKQNMPIFLDAYCHHTVDDSGIYVAGIIYDNNSLFAAKLTRNYEIVWLKNYVFSESYSFDFVAGVLTNNYLCLISSLFDDEDSKIYIMKIDKRDGTVKRVQVVQPINGYICDVRGVAWGNTVYFAATFYVDIYGTYNMLIMSYNVINDNIVVKLLDLGGWWLFMDVDGTGVYICLGSYILKVSHDLSTIYWAKEVETYGDVTLIKSHRGKVYAVSWLYYEDCDLIELNATTGSLIGSRTLTVKNTGFESEEFYDNAIQMSGIYAKGNILYLCGYKFPEYPAIAVIMAINLTDYSQAFCKVIGWALIESVFYHEYFDTSNFYTRVLTSMYVDDLDNVYCLYSTDIAIKINPNDKFGWISDATIEWIEPYEVNVEEASVSLSTPSLSIGTVSAVVKDEPKYESIFARLGRRMVQPANIPTFYGSVTFKWWSPIDHKAFRLQISSTPDFRSILYDRYVSKPFTNYTIDQYTMSVISTRASTFNSTVTLYWRVILYDENGLPTNYDPLVFRYRKSLRVDLGIPLIPISISLEPPSLLMSVPSFDNPSGIIMIGMLAALFLFISRRQRWPIALSITAAVASIMGLLLFRNPYMFAISLVLVLLGILIDRYV